MQRIPTLLQKLTELSHQAEHRSVIEIDLMLDYTRVLYADLLEWRAKMSPVYTAPVQQEPTLAELTAAMEREESPEPQRRETPPAPAPEPPAPEPVQRMPPPAPRPAAPAAAPEAAQSAPPPVPAYRPHRPPIQSLIGINDKYQFISVLFGNDKAAYEQVLERINQSDNEQQAIQWLQAQHWDPENPATLSFFAIVSQYFGCR